MTPPTSQPRRVALITGANRGIGLATAHTLLTNGIDVCLISKDAEELTNAAAALPLERVLTLPGRAQDETHQAAAVARTLERFGRVDYLVSNVGINPVYGPLINLDLAVVRKVIDTNVIAAIGWTQHVHKAWLADHDGAIVYISSITGIRPAHGIGAYGMTKAALIHLTAQLAAELGPRVRVNSVAPGLVTTRFAASAYQGREDELVSAYPLGRLGQPRDIANAVAFLLSNDASWITGHTLAVDGGRLLTGGAQ
jgi:NAD(P)-dependent dehydrogenase (short-subunit alcohol dehydrogenase family)